MGDNNKAIVSTQQPENEIHDRTLALASEDANVLVEDEESAGVTKEQRAEVVKKKKRSKKVIWLWICAVAGVILLLLVVIVIILIFTVYKVKSPTFKATDATINGVSVSFPGIFNQQFRVSGKIDINSTAHNPNREAFKYGSTTARVLYRGEQVAEAPVAAGELHAKSTETIVLPFTITLVSDDINGDLYSDLVSAKSIPLVSEVSVEGTIKVGLIKIKHVRVRSTCDILYNLNETQSIDCHYKT